MIRSSKIFTHHSTQIQTEVQGALTEESLHGQLTQLSDGTVSPIFVSAAPASPTATGTVGQMFVDLTHAYFCVAINTWRRCEIATWP